MPKGPNEVGVVNLSEEEEEISERTIKAVDGLLEMEELGKPKYTIKLSADFQELENERVQKYLRKIYKEAGWSDVEFNLSVRSRPTVILVAP